MFSRRQRFVRLICVVHDISVTILALLFAHLLRSELIPVLLPGRSHLYPLHHYFLFIVAALIIFPCLALLLGTCDAHASDTRQAFKDALMISCVGSVALGALLYTFQAEYVIRGSVRHL
jgi:hypothetical protein